MKRRDFTLPELEQKLEALPEGALHQLDRRDYERLFGTNSAALMRLRNFAKGHSCVTNFSDEAILFRKRLQASAKQGSGQPPDCASCAVLLLQPEGVTDQVLSSDNG